MDPKSDEVLHRIVCRTEPFHHQLDQLKQQGIIRATEEDIFEAAQLFKTIQSHDCRKAKYRCTKTTEKIGKPVCRVPKDPHSEAYSYKVVDTNQSLKAFQTLEEIGLVYTDKRDPSCNT